MKNFKTAVIGTLLLLVLSLMFAPSALAAVTGTVTRWVGNMLVFDGTTGNDAFQFDVNGLRAHFGTGASDYCSSDGTTVTFAGPLAAGAAGANSFSVNSMFTVNGTTGEVGLQNTSYLYWPTTNSANTGIVTSNMSAATSGATAASALFKFYPQQALDAADWVFSLGNANNATSLFSVDYSGYARSATPVPISVYVNNVVVSGFTYGGMTLPAHPFTVTDIAYYIRTQGTGGSTNNTFQVTDGTNTCTCTFACNQATGSQIASCSNGAGTGCVYAASAALQFKFSGVGDCTGPTDLLGNMQVLGKWQ